ncbi:efflux RND transporter periplasmic adaptor subunit [Mucilaginibacter sp. KACC 22063]|uniref:efflux RND transporter periplasmic adaptor subunit n=1 Tax=Mucilaginibacter sp. KACC 22063 TaxID=3025666 RepID=UPI002365321F|nr:efflux RND transporter periplasmic adaptor subunit [Mucilaginibacter sp. KACC 22063]WDF56640.1 efflux RND transporter periplasmic adaptor subunit [Mucilaginibacter sp. KACC 22063]
MKTTALKLPVKVSRTLLALTVCGLALSSCGDKKEKEKEEQAQEQQEASVDTPSVETTVLEKGKLSSVIQVPGELAPFQQVDLYAKTNSYVKQLLVDVGSEVHKGQLLVMLDAPEVNSQLAEAKARIAQQQAIFLASKANYDRLVNTAKTPGTIAQNDIDQAAARKDADYANVEAAKSFYKQVTANFDYLQIRAPFDGVITARNVNIGAYVGPSGKGSDLPLLVLQQQNKMRLIVSIPEAYTAGLNNKDEVKFNVRSMPGRTFTARVVRLSGALDPRLRAEHLEMDVYNKDKVLLPGMSAEVTVPLPSRDSTFILPKNAVIRSTEKVFVIKVDDTHHAKWIDVNPGIAGSDKIEVFGAGLKAGDKILTKGTDEIRDGMPLRDKPATKGDDDGE